MPRPLCLHTDGEAAAGNLFGIGLVDFWADTLESSGIKPWASISALISLRMVSAWALTSSIMASYLFSNSILASSSILDMVCISFKVTFVPSLRAVAAPMCLSVCWVTSGGVEIGSQLFTSILYHKGYIMSIGECTKDGT